MTRDTRSLTLGLGAFLAALAVLLLVFHDAAGRRAVLYSAGLALVVQAVAFYLARLASPEKKLQAWTAGAALRFVSLLVYALVLLKPLGLPPVAALVSLAVLFFITTVLESLLLTS